MYTLNRTERDALQTLMESVLLPELNRSIQTIAETLVDEGEGFHPDVAYESNIASARDEVTARLAEYLCEFNWWDETGLYADVFDDQVALPANLLAFDISET